MVVKMAHIVVLLVIYTLLCFEFGREVSACALYFREMYYLEHVGTDGLLKNVSQNLI